MTPQEKAHEMVERFYNQTCHLIPVEDGNERSERFRKIQPIAKHSALIAVGEMLEILYESPEKNKNEIVFCINVTKEIKEL
jgi:hypothetical protein